MNKYLFLATLLNMACSFSLFTVSDHEQDHFLHVRKNVERLSSGEKLRIRRAMTQLQADKSQAGYQSFGAFHGLPKWCPTPDAQVKYACCVHGMATFPHWHRLLVVQFENALRRYGHTGSLPYWDWTVPMDGLPDLASHELYNDPTTGMDVPNPFFKGHIDEENAYTSRNPNPKLFIKPGFGDYTRLAELVLLAFEQDNFCDFEIQFEIAHNAIHALIGTDSKYSLSSLRYTSFDPIFYLHHSNVDRIWAIWQALQHYRGKAYNTANCALQQMRKPLAPFSLSSAINTDSMTRDHSTPFSVFDYKTNFHYRYDNLEFNGLTIPQLDKEVQKRKSQDRTFVGFMLHGIGQSAKVTFYICRPSAADCMDRAGAFFILGDDREMPWSFDRLYKADITKELKNLGLRYDDKFIVRYDMIDLAGNSLSNMLPTPTIMHENHGE